MNKTALQLHIEDLEKAKQAIDDISSLGIVSESIHGCIENAKTFLAQEKKQIVEAYEAGRDNITAVDYAVGEYVTPEQYFNEQFNQK